MTPPSGLPGPSLPVPGSGGSTLDDATLLRRSLSGSERAWNELFERYFDRVHAYVAARTVESPARQALVARAMECAFRDLHRAERGADLALRCFRAARGVLASHASVTESPRGPHAFVEPAADEPE